MSKAKNKKKIVVAVSGGFDPVHIGHIRLFQEAKKLGDELVVILNNDNWLMAKKGYFFIPQNERKEILEAINCVDRVVLTKHPPNPKDMSVCRELEEIRPDIFANGGDRHYHNIPEVFTCNKIGCKMVFNVGRGGKVQSSSWIVERYKRINSLLTQARKFLFKKIIIFDLDGTLTKSKHNLDDEMSQVLGLLLEKKYVAVIGGGNRLQFQNQFLRFLKCKNEQLKNLLILPTSGAEFYQFKNGNWSRVYKYVLKKDEKRRILQAFERAFKDINYKKPEKTYGPVIEDRETQITFSALGQKAPLSEKEEWNKNCDVRKKLKSALEKYLPGFEIRLGGLTSIDVTKKGIDKAFGVSQVLKFWKMSKKDALYVGDALYKDGNDYIVKKAGFDTLAVNNEEDTKIFIHFLLNNHKQS